MEYRFGPFVADRTAYRVSRGDQALDLTPKLLDLLFYLLERPAALVTKEALLDGVWPGANVTDNALAQAVSELRDALNDDPAAPTYIRTISRRGYRFIAPVEALEAVAPAAPHLGTESHDGGAASWEPETDGSGSPRTLAVLDFTNVTGDPDVAWLSAGIAETVTADLADMSRFRIIDRGRVSEAERRTGGDLHQTAAQAGAALVVAGSFQRSGPHLRITARMIDLERGETVADAKIDGRLDDVFAAQDEVAAAFARELGVAPPSRPHAGVRETANIAAYRAYIEGWLKIESLDTSLVGAAAADFERAIASDPRYGMAYTGLAHAKFVAFEMTRCDTTPDAGALETGIAQAHLAIELDDRLAEAHATLAILLASAARFPEARRAARRAVSLEPDNWRHQYRLGHASWGDERLRALEHTLALYPQFSYARYEMAMVFIARGDMDAAERLVVEGIGDQDRRGQHGDRFPAVGFHWMLGAMLHARGDAAAGAAEFEREIALAHPRRLYGPEYAAHALVARAHAELELDRAASAAASAAEALAHVPGYARAHLAAAMAHDRLGARAAAAAARGELAGAIENLRRTGRPAEASLVAAGEAASRGDRDAACADLERLLQVAPGSHFGWTLAIEPTLRSLHGHPAFAKVLKGVGGVFHRFGPSGARGR